MLDTIRRCDAVIAFLSAASVESEAERWQSQSAVDDGKHLADRDETVFGDPDAYRAEEHAPHNLVYGTGIHACPGRPLATLELVLAVQTLVARQPASSWRPTQSPCERPTRLVAGGGCPCF